jgi:hypothetical protein
MGVYETSQPRVSLRQRDIGPTVAGGSNVAVKDLVG